MLRINFMDRDKNPRRTMAKLLVDRVIFRELPGWDNPRKLAQHAVATMMRVTESKNLVLAFGAAKWLAEYARQLEMVKPSGAGRDESVEVVAQLRALYKKALPSEAAMDLVEAEEPEGSE